MSISLCLLVWNEVEGCRIDVPRLPLQEFDEVFAVDGGSTDGTVEYLESQGITVYKQPQKGLNAAYWHAIENSSCTSIVVFFPKGTIEPSTLLQFRELFEKGYEVIVASRNCKGARNEEDEKFLKPRKWGVLALSYLVALLWRREGPFFHDVLHGYKGFTADAFYKIAPSRIGLSIDLEVAIRSYRLNMKAVEFSVVEHARQFGETRFKILPTGIKLLRCLVKELCRP
jgi:glycosyltransferase involved in cell wall biosynthesis